MRWLNWLLGIALFVVAAVPAPSLAQQPEAVASRRDPGLSGLACTFGYETLADEDGSPRYARTKADGRRIEFSDAEFQPILRQLRRFHEANPWTARAFRHCPELCDLVAAGLERGVSYEGAAEGANSHPHALDHKFWSKEPIFRGRDARGRPLAWGDPVDGAVLFVLEMLNALQATRFESAWDVAWESHQDLLTAPGMSPTQRLQRWTENRDRWVQAEAGIKAENLAAAVRMVRKDARGLALEANLKAGYGQSFQYYDRWVREATNQDGIDYRALADQILANDGKYRDEPAAIGLTYKERLERIFAELLPLK